MVNTAGQDIVGIAVETKLVAFGTGGLKTIELVLGVSFHCDWRTQIFCSVCPIAGRALLLFQPR